MKNEIRGSQFCLYVALLSIFFFSCSHVEDTDSDRDIEIRIPVKPVVPKVEIFKLTMRPFNEVFLSSGIVRCKYFTEVKFPVSGTIHQIFVTEGDQVKENELLASLDKGPYEEILNRRKEELDKAEIYLDETLIDFGYRLKDSVHVPKEVMLLAKRKSNYINALYDYRDALRNLTNSEIRAVHDGVVCNLAARRFNTSSDYKSLCTIMDPSTAEVVFDLLEQEAIRISPVSEVVINSPLWKQSYKARITSINPVVNKGGMVTIHARIIDRINTLYEGTAVKVSVNVSRETALVIPNSALVRVDQSFVVYTYENGKAIWNYVKPGRQNDQFVVIDSGLVAGKNVIISNAYNLSHELPVVLQR